MHTFGIMARLFRYTVYGSVLVAIGGSTLYLSVHAYVEYFALHGMSRVLLDSEEAAILSPEDVLPGYSGAHLGGGTDPSLGWRGRFAARGAWIAENLHRGGVVPGTSGKSAEYAVPDLAWLEAERYLAYAASQADLQPDSSAKARWELLGRLAEVRSRLAGPRGLGDARRSYQQLLMELQQESAQDDAHIKGKILDTETRLAELEQRILRESSLGRIGQSGNPSLGSARLSRALLQALHVSRPAVTDSTHSAEHCSTLAAAISSIQLESLDPALQRSVLDACISFVQSTAALGDYSAAKILAEAAFCATEAASQAFAMAKATNQQATTPVTMIHRSWLAIKLATLLAYRAELSHSDDESAKAKPSEISDESDHLLATAVTMCDKALHDLPTSARLGSALNAVRLASSRASAGASYTRGALIEASRQDYRSALHHYEEAYASLGESTDVDARKKMLHDVRRCREYLAVP